MEVAASLANSEIEAVLLKLNKPLLVDFECFDVFNDPSGQKLSTDRKSLAYRFTYRSPERTLKTKEVDTAHANVLDALTRKLKVNFR